MNDNTIYNCTIKYTSGKIHSFKNVRINRDLTQIEIFSVKNGKRIQKLTLGMWKSFTYSPLDNSFIDETVNG